MLGSGLCLYIYICIYISESESPGKGQGFFVSHQWIGGSHPDPEFRQFKAAGKEGSGFRVWGLGFGV